MDFIWPADLPIASQDLAYVDSTEAFPATLTNDLYTVGRGGDRWRMSVSTPTVSTSRLRSMQTMLAQLRGRANRLWIPDYAYQRHASGAFTSSELLSNTTFAATTGWTAGANFTLSVSAVTGRLRATKTATGSEYIHCGPVTVTANLAYVVRMLALQGKGAASITLAMGTTAGATDIGSATAETAYRMMTLAAVPAGTTVYPSLIVTGLVAGDWFEVGYATMAKCLRLDGASQTSNAVDVKNAPNSTPDLLLPGDLVEIVGSGFHRVTSPLNSGASGTGALMVYPPARGANADAAAVIVHAPLFRGVLNDGDPSFSMVPGRFSQTALTFLESPL